MTYTKNMCIKFEKRLFKKQRKQNYNSVGLVRYALITTQAARKIIIAKAKKLKLTQKKEC